MKEFKKKVLRRYKDLYEGDLLNCSEVSCRDRMFVDYVMRELFYDEVVKKNDERIRHEWERLKNKTNLSKKEFKKRNKRLNYLDLNY